jgi:hypothetical protein
VKFRIIPSKPAKPLPPMMEEEKLTIWLMAGVAGIYMVSLACNAVFGGGQK